MLNKNKRGTLTPERFNELCRVALNGIYRNLVNERRRYLNRKSTRRGGPAKEEIDKALLRYYTTKSFYAPGPGDPLVAFDLPDDFGFTTDNYLFIYPNYTEVPLMSENAGAEFYRGITAPSATYPQHRIINNIIYMYPPVEEPNITILKYYRQPKTPNWTYVQGTGDLPPMFNPSDASYEDVDLYEHRTEELIMEILVLAGLSIKEQTAIQVGLESNKEDFNDNNSI